MTKLFNENVEVDNSDIISAMLKRQEEYVKSTESYIPSKDDVMTDLKCRCGGFLVQRPTYSDHQLQEAAERVIGKMPKHKRTRIQKKWRKKWAEKAWPIMFGLSMCNVMGPRGFVCSKCGSQEGFYSVIGRNLVVVEPLSLGADISNEYWGTDIPGWEEHNKMIDEKKGL